jgi:type IV pilus assembly protein PilV
MNQLANCRHPRARRQRGSFLLEALIAILIVSLGVLGLVALQTRAMQQTDDSHLRSEAAFLVNDVMSQMWLADPATMAADFTTGGASYNAFKTLVQSRLPGSTTVPAVTVTQRGATPTSGFDVVVTIFWKPPSVVFGPENQYTASATIRLN